MRNVRHTRVRRAGAALVTGAILLAGPSGPAAAAPSDNVVYLNNRSKQIVKCYRIHQGAALPMQTLPVGGGLKITSPEVVIACPGVRNAEPASGGALLNAGRRYQLSRAADGFIHLNYVGLNE